MTIPLQAALASFEGVEYTVRVVDTRRIERYGVRCEAEMNRRVEVRHIYLTLYKVFEEDGQTYRGSYATEVHPTATEAEVRDTIAHGLFAAGFVKNAYYPLVEPVSPETPLPVTASVTNPAETPEETLTRLVSVFDKLDTHGDGHICYNEIYVTDNHTRIFNSNGVDVSYGGRDIYVETAVHWRNADGNDTEITETFRMDNADTEYLEKRLCHLYEIAEEKSRALPTPQLTDVNILLSGECLRDFFEYYKAQSDAQFAFRQLSTFETGCGVQGDTVTGDRVTLILDPALPGSTHSRPYDNDGRALASHTVIENGKLNGFWGSTRFAHYMQIPPTGDIINFVITGGTATDDALRSAPYIELLSFSAFQMNEVTGDFGSEIRLGFYYDGKTRVPVTGGSVSGNIKKVQAAMRLSAKQQQLNYFRGPATVLINGASIAGV